jgi:hypothetical protein
LAKRRSPDEAEVKHSKSQENDGMTSSNGEK